MPATETDSADCEHSLRLKESNKRKEKQKFYKKKNEIGKHSNARIAGHFFCFHKL